jgi:imidazolonepropionase-like amidohydrolase
MRALCLFLLAMHARPSPVAFTHITVIDPDQSKPLADMTLVIANGKIQRLVPSRAAHLSRDTEVINSTGKFLIPALWDMHVHSVNPKRDLPLYIANGVLGVRNMSGVMDEVFLLRRQIEDGTLLGPQIIACGPQLDGANPVVPRFSIAVHDAKQGREAVDRLKTAGADCIKPYDGLTRDAYFAIADESKQKNIPFGGHVPVSVRIGEAVDAGQRSIEHGAPLRGGSAAEELSESSSVMETAMKTGNYSLIPESIAKKGNLMLDHYREDLAAEMYRNMARHNTHLTPTLVTSRSLTFVDEISKHTDDPRLRFVSKKDQQGWKPDAGFLTRYRTPAYIVFRKREYATIQKSLLLAHKLGVPILAGTDVSIAYVYPGFSLHQELKLLVELGLTPREALQTATTNPARFLHLGNGLGTVKSGSVASFVVLDANPLTDIQNVDKVNTVVVRGKIMQRQALDDLLHQGELAVQ